MEHYAAPAAVVECMKPASAVVNVAPSQVRQYTAPAPAVSFAPAAFYVTPAPVVEYNAPAASYVTPSPVDEYIALAPRVDAAPAAPAPAVYAAPAPFVEYLAPVPTVCAAPAPVVEYIAPIPAVCYVAPAPIGDVHGPQFHEGIAETSNTATSCGGRVRKSARLSPNGPEVFEFECGSGSSLHPLPRPRRRLPRTPGVGEKGRKLARLSAALLPDVNDLRPENDKETLELQETIGRR